LRFVLYGGSNEEFKALREFAHRLGAGFSKYKGSEEEEPVLMVECLPRRIGLLEALEQVTGWMDGGPLPERAWGVQNPLPGLETPPCR